MRAFSTFVPLTFAILLPPHLVRGQWDAQGFRTDLSCRSVVDVADNSTLNVVIQAACHLKSYNWDLAQDFAQNMANGLYDNRVALNVSDAERVFCYGGELLASTYEFAAKLESSNWIGYPKLYASCYTYGPNSPYQGTNECWDMYKSVCRKSH